MYPTAPFHKTTGEGVDLPTRHHRSAVRVLAVLAMLAGALLLIPRSRAQDLSWSSDVGAGSAGTSSYNAVTKVYQVSGAGVGLGGSADAFHFAYYQAVCGDGQIVIRITSADSTAQPALVLRETLDPASSSAAITLNGGSARFVRRTASGGTATVGDAVSVNLPCWFKLARSGGSVSTFVSADGQTWTSLGSDTVDLGSTNLFAGLAVSNRMSNAASTASASFDGELSTFLPAEGLQLWLKGDAGVTQDAGGHVSVWADESGHGNDAAQTTGGNQPQLVAAALNAQSVLRFDGSSSYLRLPSGFSDFTQGATALVVAKPTANNAWERILELANGPSVDSIVFCRYSSSDQLLFETVNGNGNLVTELTSGGGALALDTPQLFEFSQSSAAGTAILYKNGQALATQPAGTIANVTRTSNYLGYTNFGGVYYQGDLAEVVLFDHPLSETDRQAWERYLNAKYLFNPPPAVPDQLQVMALSSTRLALSWTESSQTVSDYRVERQGADGVWSLVATVSGTVTRYVDSGLAAGASYQYRVSAENAGMSSAASSAATGTTNTASSGDESLPVSGLRLWLRADAGVLANAGGAVNTWADQSGYGHDAVQGNGSRQPTATVGSFNSQSALHFNANTYLQLPDHLMDGAGAGDLLLVLRSTAAQGVGRGLLNLSANYGDWVPYRDGMFYEGFGSSQRYGPFAVSGNLSQVCLYDLTSAPGQWTARKNGQIQYANTGNTVLFPAGNLTLGISSEGVPFEGDIAEAVLFDHSLSNAERQAWEQYFNLKYQYDPPPNAPTQVAATGFSGTQMLVSWSEATQSVNGYTVERQNQDGTWSTIATPTAGTTNYIDGGLTPNTTYAYRVTAANAQGDSPVSAVASGTTKPTGSTAFPVNGLQLWLRADLGITVDANGAVSAWTDQVGGSVASQSDPASQPLLQSADLNGMPAVRFDGSNGFLNSSFVGMGGQELTFFVVAKGTQYQSLLRFQPAGSGNYLIYPWYTSQFFIDSADGGTGAGVACGLVNGQWNIGAVTYKAGDRVATYRNGELVASRAAGTAALPSGLGLTIGRYLAGGEFLQADLAEVLIYNRALSDTEREAVEHLLNEKYAVIAPPGAPASLVANAISSTQANLWWNVQANATGYSVERKATAAGAFEEVAAIAGGDVAAYIDGSLAPEQNYVYRVRAANAAGYSAYSNEAGVTLPAMGQIAALPTDDLLLWLRPDAGVTQAADGKVTGWNDVSGHGNNAFAPSGHEPVWTPNVLSGQPVLRFDGSAAYLKLPGGFRDFTRGMSALIVTRLTSAVTWERLLELGNDAPADNLLFARYAASNDLVYDAFNGGALGSTLEIPEVLTLDDCQLLEVVHGTTGAVTAYKNGVQVAQGAATSIVNVLRTNNFVGWTNWGGALFQGDIAEIALFDYALTDTERQSWEFYLNAKYQFNPPPPTPTQLKVSPLSSTQTLVSWNENYPTVSGYSLERRNADGTWSVIANIVGNTTSYVDGALTPGTVYCYRVTASNAFGSSSTCAPVTGLSGPAGDSGLFPTTGLRLWLQAGAGTNVDATGSVSTWLDQSGHGASATQLSIGNQPHRIDEVVNGNPVVRFTGAQYFNLPNLMVGATAGEMFVVFKNSADPGRSVFTHFGGDLGDYYERGTLHCDFGSTESRVFVPSADGTQFNLYDFSSQAGLWQCWVNGALQLESTSNTVQFIPTPWVGRDGYGCYLLGDFAEVLVFDHSLSVDERHAVERYCASRYALTGLIGGAADGDPDGDGITTYQEYLSGTDPQDYYNGQTPHISIASGNNQYGSAGALLAQPLRVAVTSTTGLPLANAPVVFTVTRANGMLANPLAPADCASTVTVRTGVNGIATVLFQAPTQGIFFTSLVTATAGTLPRVSQVTLAEAIAPDDDTSGDGLPDGWKAQFGFNLSVNQANGDPDGDGLTNLQEYYLGTDPLVAGQTAGGVPYDWLIAHGLDPRYDSPESLDTNGQGLTYLEEYQLEQSAVDLWPFDEGIGSTSVFSMLGRQDPGILVNTSQWTADPDGGWAVRFNAVGAYVDLGNPTDGHLDFGPLQSFSLTARFRSGALGTARLIGKGDGLQSGKPGYVLGMKDGRLALGVGDAGGDLAKAMSFSTLTTYDDGQWHHVAAVLDRMNRQASLYVDGIIQPVAISPGSAGTLLETAVDFSAATDLSAVNANLPLTVGNNSIGGEQWWGAVDNVGIFTKALTQAEIKKLAGNQENQAPSVSLSAPLASAMFPDQGDIVIQAQAASQSGIVAKVEFFSGSSKLGEATAAPYQFVWHAPVGVYSLTAKATDSRGASSTSMPVAINVMTDSDHDGLPDAWELQHFGNLDQTAAGSYLNDGVSNLSKYQLGIDPICSVTTGQPQDTDLVVFTPLH